MKKFLKVVIGIVVVLVAVVLIVFFMLIPEDDTEPDIESNSQSSSDEYGATAIGAQIEGLRPYYVDDTAAENAVIMVYMIGSDLESAGGCATTDLEEMLSADLGENLQVVVQTGGASEWMAEAIGTGRQRWLMDQAGMTYLEDVGDGSMVNPDSLTDFISWTAQNFPADRYMLMFWDHGGGTVGGFGYDEVEDEGALSIQELAYAIEDSGVKFNLIGFDACLMATVETAYALEPYADYLIASEEYEPGDGWYYTDALTLLGSDPAVPTVSFGEQIIDSFAEYYDNEGVTLSLIDLREIPYVYEKLSDFLLAAEQSIQETNSNFKMLSQARSNAREYCDGEIDQVDILDTISKTEFDGKNELEEAVRSCVKYYNNSSLTGSNGLAMYFPYSAVDSYDDTRQVLNEIGFTRPTEFYNYFLSIMAGGQSRNMSRNEAKQPEETDYSQESWYEDYQANFDYGDEYGELYLEETENGYELILPDDVWDLITDVKLSVMVSYADGLLDLGNDNVSSWLENGNLLVDFDYTWLGIDGIPIAFYADKIYDDEEKVLYSGRSYALLNDETEIELVLEWDPLTNEMAESGDYELQGHVMGYRIVNYNNQTQAKGLFTLKPGDTLRFLYDYYDADGAYVESITADDPVTVTSQEQLSVAYGELEDYDVSCWYTLVDIYQQELYTETIEYTESW